MNKNLCVTSGIAYTDIDALACAIEFAELYSAKKNVTSELLFKNTRKSYE